MARGQLLKMQAIAGGSHLCLCFGYRLTVSAISFTYAPVSLRYGCQMTSAPFHLRNQIPYIGADAVSRNHFSHTSLPGFSYSIARHNCLLPLCLYS